ncbi:MAG: hypothetical protein NT033_05495, partial [Candidatus Omnitrophica bacterium]|nr:hypothetical protein [Candidatus Omnitrophota bacterium]
MGRNALAFIVILLSLFLSSACAQDSEEDHHNELDGYVRNMPSRSLKSQSGSVRITESRLDYTYK